MTAPTAASSQAAADAREGIAIRWLRGAILGRRVPGPRETSVRARHPLSRRATGLALGVLLFGVFLSGADQTVVVAVLPRIITDLQIPLPTGLNRAFWIVTAYLLGYTVVMPLLGRAADVYGHRVLFVLCTVVFAVGSAMAAVAHALGFMVAARAVQAVGGGGMVPVALAAAAVLYQGRARLLALGAVAGAAELGGVVGPAYGALMVHELGWRSIFWINLPLSVGLIAAVVVLLREAPQRHGRVDYVGGLLLGVSLLALTLGLSGGTTHAIATRRPLLFAIAAVTCAVFLAWQTRARWPLISLSLFRKARFGGANLANLFIGAALIVALVEVPLFTIIDLHRSDTAGGLMLLRLTGFIPFGAIAGGWLSGRLPYPVAASGGMLLSAVGFLRMSGWGTTIGEPRLAIDLAITGLGFGFVLAPLAGSVLGAARGGSETVGSAMLTVSRMVGMTVGLAAMGKWGLEEYERRITNVALPAVNGGQAAVNHYTAASDKAALFVFDRLFLIAAILCGVAAIISLVLRPSPEHARAAPERVSSSPGHAT